MGIVFDTHLGFFWGGVANQNYSRPKIVNDEIIFVRGKVAKAQPTQRSESRGSLLTLPSRKEEKPAKQD